MGETAYHLCEQSATGEQERPRDDVAFPRFRDEWKYPRFAESTLLWSEAS